jgi:hypothetical protein
MKKALFCTAAAFFLFMISCDDDEIMDPINQVGETKVYNLESVSDPNVFGTATFIRNEDNSTTVQLEIENLPSNVDNPAHIHLNSALEGGNVAIGLNPVESGRSSTTFSETDDGTALTYTDLMVFDGHLDIHLSPEQAEVLLKVDIGNNELTGESKIYPLDSVDVSGTSGTATFEKRKSGEILATILVQPANDGETYPVHIHENHALQPGNIALTLNSVDGTTGKSQTNVNELDDGTDLTFEDLLLFDGSLDIHLSESDLTTVLARGDIGQNELTGESESYLLEAVADPNINGSVQFAARTNRETLVTIFLEGTTAGNLHPAHIHDGKLEDGPGSIAVSLNDVVGETGMSKTNVSALDNGDSLSYDNLLIFDGYLDVHQSAIDLSTILAEGNIGVNDE